MKKWMKISLWMVTFSLCLLISKQTVKASTDYDAEVLSKKGSIVIKTGESGKDGYDYIRFVAPYDGYVVFTSNMTPNTDNFNGYSGRCYLCNAKKRRITSVGDDGFGDESSHTYAVKKNKIYYLKVSTSARGEYRVDYKYTKVKEKIDNNKKSRAATLKRKTVVKGLLIAGEKKADWYKIKLTKKQVLKLTVSVKSYRGIQVDVYDKYGEKVSGLDFYQPCSGNETEILYSRNWNDTRMKLAPGTYYVKVYILPGSMGCGYYSLKWQ